MSIFLTLYRPLPDFGRYNSNRVPQCYYCIKYVSLPNMNIVLSFADYYTINQGLRGQKKEQIKNKRIFNRIQNVKQISR